MADSPPYMTEPAMDEHGEVQLDPSMPADVQQTAQGLERWHMCIEIAAMITGQPAASAETRALAGSLYDRPVPTHRDDTLELQESQPGFDDLHPRDRVGEFARKPGLPLKKLKRRQRIAPPPGVSLDEIKAAGLDEWPKPSDAALELMDGHPDSANRWYANRKVTDADSDEHPPYKAARRRRHDRIVGGALAASVGTLLGADHPATVKLAKGGRLSADEKEEVRKAAHEARSGESPQVLFMAGGPASGKTTTLKENPELRPDAAVHVDPDAIKEQLPEFQALRAKNDRYAASAVRLESGDIAARLASEAEAMGLNSVVDGTGDSEPQDFVRQLQRKYDAGYDVHVLYKSSTTDDAIKRAIVRAEETGRLVPIPAVREQHAKVSRNFSHVLDLPWLEQLDVFDDGGHIGVLHDGEFHNLEPERMAAFKEKEHEPYG